MIYCSRQVSVKIKVLSFWATLAVIVIHSNSLESINDNAFAWWIGNAIAVLQYWAVPYFFVVSGFFFDRGYVLRDISAREFLRKKVFSLGLPYLLWGAVFGGAVLTPVLMYVNLRGGRPICENTFMDASSSVFAVDRLIGGFSGAPPNGALWYIRMLLVIFLFAPIIKWLRKQFCVWVILCIGIFLIAFSSAINHGREMEMFVLYTIPVRMKLSGIGYFILGMVISAYSLENRSPRTMTVVPCVLIWFVGMLLAVFLRHKGIRILYPIELFERFSPLLAIIFLWTIPWEQTFISSDLISMRFWIYCMHHPITSYVSAGLHAIVGHSLCAEFFNMAVGPPICLLIVVLAGLMVRKVYPRMFGILNGGR